MNMPHSNSNTWGSDIAQRIYGERTSIALENGFRGHGPRDLQQILNTRPDAVDQRDFPYRPSLINIPARSFNTACLHRKFRIKEQGNEGTCVGQALASLIDLQNLQRHEDGADVPTRVSARFLYTNAQLYDHHPEDSLEGSSLRGAIKGFYHNGACKESLARYFAHQSFKIDNPMRVDARRVALGTYFRLNHVLNNYHCALMETGAILCSALTHTGWGQADVAMNQGVISYPYTKRPNKKGRLKDTPCDLSGGHAFVIVGYNEEGFLVLNSWGKHWGNYPVAKLRLDNLSEHELKSVYQSARTYLSDDKKTLDSTLPGIALWRYEDWADNVLDAWILRLAAPTGHGTDYIGGRLHKAVPKESRSGAARKQDVQGHYMHVRDGILVEEPPYENDLDYFRETALEIRNNPAYRDYRHLVFFVHGGLGTLDSASSRAAAMIPTFKKHGVYPMFLFWRTGFGAMLGSVLEGILPAVEKRSQDYTEIKDASIERLAKPIGRAIWNDIRRNAQACYDKEYYHHVDDLRGPIPVEKLAWTATQEFLKICTEPSENHKNRALKIHFVGHSAGAFILGELFQRLSDENDKELTTDIVESVSMMVPCCRTNFMKEKVFDICRVLGRKKFTVFNLDEPSEQSIDPHMLPYSKSFASLVSNAFYDTKPERIAALDEYWKSDLKQYLRENKWTSKVDYVRSGEVTSCGIKKCSASYHSEFDNDADSMNYVLRKILGRSRAEKIRMELDGFSPEQLSNGNF